MNRHMDKDAFLNPRSRYYGIFTPANLAFNANLQEFSTRVGYIANLQAGGKLEPVIAYAQVKALWKQLKRSRKALDIDS